jgi:hypothetical protein
MRVNFRFEAIKSCFINEFVLDMKEEKQILSKIMQFMKSLEK